MAVDASVSRIAPRARAFRSAGRRTTASGFSLVEMMVVCAIFGLLIAATMPAFKSFQDSQALIDATTQISEQLQTTRQKAIATGATQEIRFMYDFGGASDYHIWSDNVAKPSWRLPKNVKYFWGAGTQNTYRWTSDGRCLDFGWIIVENARGTRDTIGVRTSGMVFVY